MGDNAVAGRWMTQEKLLTDLHLIFTRNTLAYRQMSDMEILYQFWVYYSELFFNLPLVGVGEKPPHPRMKAIESLSRRLQRINKGYEVEGTGIQGRILLEEGGAIETKGVLIVDIKMMCYQLCSPCSSSASKAHRDYQEL